MHNPTIRVLKILGMISQNQNLRLSDFSRELDIPKSTLLPIMQTLCQYRYLSQNEDGKYTAGSALFTLGASFFDSFPVLEYIRSQLADLVELFGETCYCGTLVNGSVLYVEKVDSSQPLRMLTSLGKQLPAYATSIGKALLLDKTEEELCALYPNGLKPLTSNTLTDISELSEQLSVARQDGYTWEIEESMEHIRCFAAPIRKFGKIVAAISIAIPLFRYQEDKKDEIVKFLCQYAQQMSRTIEQTNAHFGEAF